MYDEDYQTELRERLVELKVVDSSGFTHRERRTGRLFVNCLSCGLYMSREEIAAGGECMVCYATNKEERFPFAPARPRRRIPQRPKVRSTGIPQRPITKHRYAKPIHYLKDQFDLT